MVIPGYIRTTRWNDLTEEVIQTRRANIPLHQEATYEDVANAVVFFACEDSKNITGTSLVVDGGASMQWLPKAVDV
jgi:NAD(P)-dependent dehydrogenase (short-subunit alcohol dehydrogenase family)